MKTSNLISTPFVNSKPIHTVRPALHQDAATIAAIHVAACQIAYRGEAPTSTLEQLQTEGGTTAWGSLIESPGSILLAEDRNGTVTGFSQIHQSCDPEADHTVAEIPSICVDPPSWRIGTGRVLCESSLKRAEQAGFETVTLWVPVSNERARSFFEAMGFQLDGASRSEDRLGFRMKEFRYRHPLD